MFVAYRKDNGFIYAVSDNNDIDLSKVAADPSVADIVEITDGPDYETVKQDIKYWEVNLTEDPPKLRFKLGAYRQAKMEWIKQKMYEVAHSGMMSQTLGVEVDCAREDLDNFRNLLQYMESNNIESTQIRTFTDDFVECTQDQLRSLIDEIIQFGLQLYQIKWQLENQLEQARGKDEIDAIEWPS